MDRWLYYYIRAIPDAHKNHKNDICVPVIWLLWIEFAMNVMAGIQQFFSFW